MLGQSELGQSVEYKVTGKRQMLTGHRQTAIALCQSLSALNFTPASLCS